MFVSAKKLFLFSVCLFFLVLSAHRAEAIGISPPIVNMPHVLKGGSQAQTILIFRDSDAKGDVTIAAKPRGVFARYLVAPAELIIPNNKDSAAYTFQVAPKDAAVGNYEVLMDFFQTEKKAGEDQGNKGAASAQVSVIRGVTAIIRFSVSGDQVLSYRLVDFQAMDSEIDLPLPFKYNIENTGNVDWKPSKIEIAIKDVIDPTKSDNLVADGKDLDLIIPGGITESSLQLKHNLLEGTYIATAVFYDNDKVAGELSSQQFRIYPPGTLKQSGELTSLKTNKDQYKMGEKIKLTANFKNTGEVSTQGLLVTEIYQGQELLDELRSEKVDANKGEEVELSQIVDLLKPGAYTFTSYVEYGNKKTPAKSTNITIQDQQSMPTMIYAGGFAAIVIIIIALVAFFI
jgi:hypothetical protein